MKKTVGVFVLSFGVVFSSHAGVELGALGGLMPKEVIDSTNGSTQYSSYIYSNGNQQWPFEISSNASLKSVYFKVLQGGGAYKTYKLNAKQSSDKLSFSTTFNGYSLGTYNLLYATYKSGADEGDDLGRAEQDKTKVRLQLEGLGDALNSKVIYVSYNDKSMTEEANPKVIIFKACIGSSSTSTCSKNQKLLILPTIKSNNALLKFIVSPLNNSPYGTDSGTQFLLSTLAFKLNGASYSVRPKSVMICEYSNTEKCTVKNAIYNSEKESQNVTYSGTLSEHVSYTNSNISVNGGSTVPLYVTQYILRENPYSRMPELDITAQSLCSSLAQNPTTDINFQKNYFMRYWMFNALMDVGQQKQQESVSNCKTLASKMINTFYIVAPVAKSKLSIPKIFDPYTYMYNQFNTEGGRYSISGQSISSQEVTITYVIHDIFGNEIIKNLSFADSVEPTGIRFKQSD